MKKKYMKCGGKAKMEYGGEYDKAQTYGNAFGAITSTGAGAVGSAFGIPGLGAVPGAIDNAFGTVLKKDKFGNYDKKWMQAVDFVYNPMARGRMVGNALAGYNPSEARDEYMSKENRTAEAEYNPTAFNGAFRSGGITMDKAKEMLRDGMVNGRALTTKQKKYFGLIAGGGLPEKKGGGQILNAEPMQELEGGEVYRTPYGDADVIKGPSHEQGGVDTTLPKGTEVLSKALGYSDKNMIKYTNDMKKYNEVINNPKSTPLAVKTSKLMKGGLDSIWNRKFSEQEAYKGVQGTQDGQWYPNMGEGEIVAQGSSGDVTGASMATGGKIPPNGYSKNDLKMLNQGYIPRVSQYGTNPNAKYSSVGGSGIDYEYAPFAAQTALGKKDEYIIKPQFAPSLSYAWSDTPQTGTKTMATSVQTTPPATKQVTGTKKMAKTPVASPQAGVNPFTVAPTPQTDILGNKMFIPEWLRDVQGTKLSNNAYSDGKTTSGELGNNLSDIATQGTAANGTFDPKSLIPYVPFVGKAINALIKDDIDLAKQKPVRLEQQRADYYPIQSQTQAAMEGAKSNYAPVSRVMSGSVAGRGLQATNDYTRQLNDLNMRIRNQETMMNSDIEGRNTATENQERMMKLQQDINTRTALLDQIPTDIRDTYLKQEYEKALMSRDVESMMWIVSGMVRSGATLDDVITRLEKSGNYAPEDIAKMKRSGEEEIAKMQSETQTTK